MSWLITLIVFLILILVFLLSFFGWKIFSNHKLINNLDKQHTNNINNALKERYEVIINKILLAMEHSKDFHFAFAEVKDIDLKIEDLFYQYKEMKNEIKWVIKRKDSKQLKDHSRKLNMKLVELKDTIKIFESASQNVVEIDRLLSRAHFLFDSKKNLIFNEFESTKIEQLLSGEKINDFKRIAFYKNTIFLKEKIISSNNHFLKLCEDSKFSEATIELLKYQNNLVEFTKIVNSYSKLDKLIFLTIPDHIEVLKQGIESKKSLFVFEYDNFKKKLNELENSLALLITKMTDQKIAFEMDNIFELTSKLYKKLQILNNSINQQIRFQNKILLFEKEIEIIINNAWLNFSKVMKEYKVQAKSLSKSEQDNIFSVLTNLKISFAKIENKRNIAQKKANEFSTIYKFNQYKDICTSAFNIEKKVNKIKKLLYEYRVLFIEKINYFKKLKITFDTLGFKIYSEKFTFTKQENTNLLEFASFFHSLSDRITNDSNLKSLIISDIDNLESKINEFSFIVNQKILIKALATKWLMKLNNKRFEDSKIDSLANQWEIKLFNNIFRETLREIFSYMKKVVQ